MSVSNNHPARNDLPENPLKLRVWINPLDLATVAQLHGNNISPRVAKVSPRLNVSNANEIQLRSAATTDDDITAKLESVPLHLVVKPVLNRATAKQLDESPPEFENSDHNSGPIPSLSVL